METIDYQAIKRKITKEAQVIMVSTDFGTAVRVTKKAACIMLDHLERHNKRVKVDFAEIGNGKSLVTIEKESK